VFLLLAVLASASFLQKYRNSGASASAEAGSTPLAEPRPALPTFPLSEIDQMLVEHSSHWQSLQPLEDEISRQLTEQSNLAALEMSFESTEALAFASRPEAILEIQRPEEGSSGHLIMVGRQRVLHIRGELPTIEAKRDFLEQISQDYRNWTVQEEIRVDLRLSVPEEGTLLTRLSLPSSEVAAGSGLVCVAPFGEAWSHITLDKPTGLTTNDLCQLGLTVGSPKTHRKLIDFQVLLPLAMDFVPVRPTVAAASGN
jgi:hypothetical protein